jgi:hypothetical protein
MPAFRCRVGRKKKESGLHVYFRLGLIPSANLVQTDQISAPLSYRSWQISGESIVGPTRLRPQFAYKPAAQPCDPIPSMKLLFGLGVLILIAFSVLADYYWKRWIAARKQERDHPPNP